MDNKSLIALVGMPGSGKSEAAAYLQKQGIPFIRFGKLTDETVKEMGLPLTPENERLAREKLRNDLGMAAYALKAIPKIQSLLKEHQVIAVDGLYSWEEYKVLKDAFPYLTLIHVFAEPSLRYARLANRPVRPFTIDQARERDIKEIENLNKGGPIAIADYLVENNSDDLHELRKAMEALLKRLKIN